MNNWIKACLAALMCMAMPALAGTLTFDTYYHNDHLGSPVAATDERSDLLWRAHFRPYGERQENPADTAFGNIGYTGHMQDADSNLVYMQARYYDPLIGRFLAVDPVGVKPGSPVSFNRYAYANNNPYRYIDPDGQIPLDYLVDGLSIAASSAIYARDPSVSNGISLAADVVLAGLPYVPAGIGLIRGGDKLLDADKAAAGAEEAVDGYRAVSRAEADDIAEHGFRPDPSGRSMQDKWFSETREGAEKFKQNYSDLDEIVKVKVPKDVYDRSYKNSNIDGTGPGFCVSCDDFSRLKVDE